MLKGIFLIAALALTSGCASENIEDNYVKIASPESHADVTMFFWYRCPACYRAENEISKWAEDKDIEVEYRHSSIWEDDAKLFYTLDLLGMTKEYQGDLMDYFRHSSNPSLEGVSKIIDEKYTAEQISRRLDSPHVKNRIQATRSYETYVGSTGVPLIVVDNKYAIVGEGLSPGSITKTIDHILARD